MGVRAVVPPDAGSRTFVRLVALSTPMPISTTTPTPIHIAGTFNKYAPIASPVIRMMKPMRYVANDDIVSPFVEDEVPGRQ